MPSVPHGDTSLIVPDIVPSHRMLLCPGAFTVQTLIFHQLPRCHNSSEIVETECWEETKI